MAELGKIACPVCGRTLQLRPHPDKENRITAACNHGRPANIAREVYETDAPVPDKKGK